MLPIGLFFVIYTEMKQYAAIALCGTIVILGSSAAQPSAERQTAYSMACNRNRGLSAYAFHMDVAMAMRHFPWLHFHMAGTGQYVRGQSYAVQFDHLPFFATAFRTVDLSPVDPSMWGKQYAVRVIGQRRGWTTFSLRPKQTDPKEQNPLVQAFVTLDPPLSMRSVSMQYAHGTIQLTVHPGVTDGFRLPAAGDVLIDMPGEALSAHALFTDYTILRSTVAAH